MLQLTDAAVRKAKEFMATENKDGGGCRPIVASAPESTQAMAFLDIASKIRDDLHSDEPNDRPSTADSIFGRFRKAWTGSKK